MAETPAVRLAAAVQRHRDARDAISQAAADHRAAQAEAHAEAARARLLQAPIARDDDSA